MRSWVKFVLSLGIWILALVMTGVGRWSIDRILIFAAVTFAFVGDVFLLLYGMKENNRDKKYFLLGLVSFAITHILYSFAFFYRIAFTDTDSVMYLYGFLIGMIMYIVICVVFFKKFSGKISFELELWVYAYVVIIGAAVVMSYGCAFANTHFLPAIGITLFAFSDFLICIREFGKVRTKFIQRSIWLLYVVGQIMIIIG